MARRAGAIGGCLLGVLAYVKAPTATAGVHKMSKRRGAAIGVPELRAHQFRRTTAHEWLSAGGGETDLTRLMG